MIQIELYKQLKIKFFLFLGAQAEATLSCRAFIQEMLLQQTNITEDNARTQPQ